MVNKPKRLTGLSQKARRQVGLSAIARRERSSAGVKSGPKSFNRGLLWNMERLLARPVRTGQTSPQGGSRAAILGRPKKRRPVVMRRICRRRSGLSWQENKQNHREEGKANDSSTRN